MNYVSINIHLLGVTPRNIGIEKKHFAKKFSYVSLKRDVVIEYLNRNVLEAEQSNFKYHCMH